jgi:hypothetical protein
MSSSEARWSHRPKGPSSPVVWDSQSGSHTSTEGGPDVCKARQGTEWQGLLLTQGDKLCHLAAENSRMLKSVCHLISYL